MTTPLILRDLAPPLLLLLAALAGVALSAWTPAAHRRASQLIAPLLMAVLFSLFARLSLGRLREAAQDLRYLAAGVGLNFLVAPLVAFSLGWFFLRDWPELWVGLVLALVTPCTDWYLIFTDLAGGDLPRNLALLPWNLVLQLVLLPVYLLVLTGRLLPVDASHVLRAFALYVAIPLAAAQFLRGRWPRVAASTWLNRAGFAALALVVVAMFSSHGAVLLRQPAVFLRMVPPMLAFYLVSILLARGAARAMGFPRERFLALACTTTARNSPMTLPLALVLFPAHPLVALSQLVEPVIEIPALILFSAWARKRIR